MARLFNDGTWIMDVAYVDDVPQHLPPLLAEALPQRVRLLPGVMRGQAAAAA